MLSLPSSSAAGLHRPSTTTTCADSVAAHMLFVLLATLPSHMRYSPPIKKVKHENMDAATSAPAARLHVVLFPWLAVGHLHAFLALAKSIARKGHRVSFVSTPGNIARLPPVAGELAARISFVALPLPAVAGLPDGAECTKDVPFENVGLLKKAFDGLEGPFSAFLAEACSGDGKPPRPDWVIVDMTHCWVPALAAEHQVPCCLFVSSSAAVIPMTLSFIIADEGALPKAAGAGPDSRRSPSAETLANDDGSGIPPMKRFVQTIQGCKLISTRSCVELEPEAAFTSERLPHVPVGMLPPTANVSLTAGDAAKSDTIIDWLEAQPPRSVIYIALGTEAPLSMEFLHELAVGIELSAVRFVWALRKPAGLGDVADGALLPEGFKERIHGRGLVTMSWVPQVKILAHESVGGFLTHCGWNSIVEGLSYGQPLVMLPIDVDQPRNAKLMEEKQAGLRIPIEEKTGSIERQGVADAVRRVMTEEDEAFRSNAKELQAFVGDKDLQEKYVERFVEYLISHKQG